MSRLFQEEDQGSGLQSFIPMEQMTRATCVMGLLNIVVPRERGCRSNGPIIDFLRTAHLVLPPFSRNTPSSAHDLTARDVAIIGTYNIPKSRRGRPFGSLRRRRRRRNGGGESPHLRDSRRGGRRTKTPDKMTTRIRLMSNNGVNHRRTNPKTPHRQDNGGGGGGARTGPASSNK